MNNQPSSKKNLWIAVAVIVLAAVGYFYYKGVSSGSSSSAGVVEQGPDTSTVGSQVLSLLSQIKSLKIDTSLFGDPAYQTLRDYSVPIPSVPVGRLNPFAPLPGLPATPAAPVTTANLFESFIVNSQYC